MDVRPSQLLDPGESNELAFVQLVLPTSHCELIAVEKIGMHSKITVLSGLMSVQMKLVGIGWEFIGYPKLRTT